MKRIYDENIGYLNEDIKNKLMKVHIGDEFRLINTRDNNINLEIEQNGKKKLILHSNYNPRKEAKRFIDNYDISKSKNIILFGFGLAYHLEELLSNIEKEQRIIVVITNPVIFKIALENRELFGLLKADNIEFILELDGGELANRLDSILNCLIESESEYISHQQSIGVIADEFLFLKDILEEIRVNKYNTKRLGSKVKENIYKNVEFINSTIGVNKFRGLFKDKPIFIISAGPSLNKNINQLRGIEDRGIIVSVDTSLSPLLKKGIKPDFVVSTEPIDTVYDRVFKNLSEKDIPLLHTFGTSNKLVREYSKKRILGLAKDDLLMDKIDKIVDKGRVVTGGTVAIAALDFVVQMGGNPIVFVGQDFAFSSEGVTHAEGTFYGNAKKDISLLRKVEGAIEKEVYTSTSYYLYLKSFEKYIKDNLEVQYIDATEGGANIRGAQIMNLADTIEEYCKINISKEGMIEEVFKSFEVDNVLEVDLQNIIKEDIF